MCANLFALETNAPPVFRQAEEDGPLFKGLPERAVVRRLSRVQPGQAASPYVEGVLALYHGDVNGAKAGLERAVSENAPASDAAYLLGRIAESEGETEAALKWYARAVESEPPHARAATAYLRLVAN